MYILAFSSENEAADALHIVEAWRYDLADFVVIVES
jgi:hypothetical protein